MGKGLYRAPWGPNDFKEAMEAVNKTENMCLCIHPDLKEESAPSLHLRENIHSLKDPICIFCNHLCMNGVTRDRRSKSHHTGNNFIYCPRKKKAIRTTAIPAGEICPAESGGCGEIMIPT